MTGLHFQDLVVAYGTRSVLRGVGAAPLLPGTVTALVGPNAAGKSTLMRAIAGILPIARGTIAVDCTRIEALRLRERARWVRYVPQTYATNARLSVYDAVHVAAHAAAPDEAPHRIRHAVAQTLARAGLADLSERLVCDLSGGQQQLVALAQGLVRAAPVLLLDEPTSALDLRNQLEALRLLREAATRDGITVAVAMHDLALAARHADRVILLSQGAIVADGSPGDVFSDPECGAAYGVDLVATRSASGALHIEASLP
ncbi:MAG: ABC transporter ATP-binding protein [Telmatospirillum sp.]|nr:ABC transporter ATP-binding protein [Telmatospirillum sp.]